MVNVDFAAHTGKGQFPHFLSGLEIRLHGHRGSSGRARKAKLSERHHFQGAVHNNFFSPFFFLPTIKKRGVNTCACFTMPFFTFAVVLRGIKVKDLCKAAVWIFSCPGARLLSKLFFPPSWGDGEEEECIALKNSKEKNFTAASSSWDIFNPN